MSKPLEVLLVEDNEGDIEMTQVAFENHGETCNLSVTHDGIEALDFLHKRGEFDDAPTPNIILLDLNMPRMNGKQFLENVKADTIFKAIPVIMFTSSKSPDDIRSCYESQASAYIVKPFGGNQLEHAIKNIVYFWRELSQLPAA